MYSIFNFFADSGHLYTWGANETNDVLGHKGVRYQPVPRRVPGVHRAIGIAAAKEHTVLLIGTSFPSLSTSTGTSNMKKTEKPSGVPSLQALATEEIAKHIDLFNALPLLIQSERMGCGTLISHCTRFIRRNLDAVIALAKKKHLDIFLDESITRFLSLPDNENEEDGEADGPLHPLLFDIARSGAGELGEIDSEGLEWMTSSKEILRSLPVSTLSKPSGSVALRSTRSERKSTLVNDEELARRLQAGCKISARTAEIASGVKSTPSTNNELDSKVQAKKVKMIEDSKILAEDDAEGNNAPSPSPPPASQYRCDLCDISCPDENALTMHMGGKRHRNRAKQVEEEEKKAAAEATLEAKRRQLLAADQVEARAQPQTKRSPWAAESVPQPRYRLEPPPPPIYESKDQTPQKPANHPPTWTPPTSSKALQLNSSGGQKMTTNFQSILEEEQRSKQAKTKPPPALPKQSATYAKKPPPPSSSPGTKKISLGAFLEPKRPPPKKREGPAWGTSPSPPPAATTVRSYHSTTPSSSAQVSRRKISFNEIQRKEEELKAKQDGMSAVGIEGQWYVERRERAASITAIAQEEEDMQRLIEEQLAIEEQIRQEQAFIKEQGEKCGQNSSGSRGRGKNANPRRKSGRAGQGGRGRGRGRGGRGGQGQGRGRGKS